jgi:hypothetical protein
MTESRRIRFATTFLRYWGANMQSFVWASGYEWPGFGYAADDRTLLVRWGETVGDSFPVFTLATVVSFITLAAAIIGVVLGPVLASDPATVPAVVFLMALGAACVLSITVALPLAMLVSAALASRFAPPFAPPDDEIQHGLGVYRTVIGQIRRVGIIGGILVPIGSFLMLVSAPFERVILMLSSVLPWIVIGAAVLEGLLRMIPAPDPNRSA